MIKIYGYSDDNFAIEGEFQGENEYSCFEKPIMLVVHDLTFAKSVIVTGEYAQKNKNTGAVWAITVQPTDEDVPMPDMKIEMAPHGYSPLLIIECSENTTVSELKP